MWFMARRCIQRQPSTEIDQGARDYRCSGDMLVLRYCLERSLGKDDGGVTKANSLSGGRL